MAGERVKLTVRPRDGRGSGAARRMRAEGLVPGVLYGAGKAATSFAVEERELRRALTGDHGLHAILDVVVEGRQRPHHAVLKDYQQDAVRGRLLHVDLHEVRLDRPIQAQVAVELEGDAEGVTQGGVLTQLVREVTVEALPMDVPDRLTLEISALAIGDSARTGDLRAPEGVRVVSDPEEVIVTILAPRVEVLPEEMLAEEEAAALEEVPEEERPEGAAEQPAEPEADAAGEHHPVEG